MIYVVVLFLIVRINLCPTKLLLFPTIQKPERHLAMAGFFDAMKPEKFTGGISRDGRQEPSCGSRLWACFGS
jgi:hypothetical protein